MPNILDFLQSFVFNLVFTESTLWPIQSLSCNVHELSVCRFVPLRKTHFPVGGRILVTEHIANIGIHLDVFWFYVNAIKFLGFDFLFFVLCKPAYCA